jgi:hypothetical protein
MTLDEEAETIRIDKKERNKLLDEDTKDTI